LKIFWANRLDNYNAFTLKPDEKFENLKRIEYKLKNVREIFKFHKVNTSDFCIPQMPMQRNNRCMMNDAERRLFNYVRFCYHNEPFDTIVFEHRAVTEIDTTIAIFDLITEDECFKTEITKISEDLGTDEDSFFPNWFSLTGMNDINKLILAAMERSIIIKFRNNVSSFLPTTYAWETRNIALNYFKDNDKLIKACIAH